MPSLLEVVADLQQLAEQTNSFGFRFVYRDDQELGPTFDERGLPGDCPLVQVYVTPDGRYVLTPCDRAGRPVGHPVLPNDGQAYVHGRSGVSAPPRSLYDEIREELAPVVVEEPPKRRRWWRRKDVD